MIFIRTDVETSYFITFEPHLTCRFCPLNSATPYLYRPRLMHHLHDDDYDRRMEFCEIMLKRFAMQPELIDEIIFSDEATFKLNGQSL